MPQIKNFTMVNDLSSRKKISNDPSVFGPTDKALDAFRKAHMPEAIKKPKKPFPWFDIGFVLNGMIFGYVLGDLYNHCVAIKWLIVYGIIGAIGAGMMHAERGRE